MSQNAWFSPLCRCVQAWVCILCVYLQFKNLKCIMSDVSSVPFFLGDHLVAAWKLKRSIRMELEALSQLSTHE